MIKFVTASEGDGTALLQTQTHINSSILGVTMPGESIMVVSTGEGIGRITPSACTSYLNYLFALSETDRKDLGIEIPT